MFTDTGTLSFYLGIGFIVTVIPNITSRSEADSLLARAKLEVNKDA